MKPSNTLSKVHKQQRKSYKKVKKQLFFPKTIKAGRLFKEMNFAIPYFALIYRQISRESVQILRKLAVTL